jgi:SAM-dependent methyltransferase
MNEQEMLEVFFEIHKDIPREGPGEFGSTKKAFSMLSDLPKEPNILDIGCGPGRQTLDLIRLTAGKIIAVDTHQPFLDGLSEEVAHQGLSDRITVLNRDMFDLGFDEMSFDLIWSEGSIYIIGFEKGLRTWLPLLKKDGYLAATELTWLKPDAPEETRDFWEEAYPAMQGVEDNLKVIRQTGYRPIGHFTIPESAWWNDYYNPIEKRLATLREKYRANIEAMGVLALEQKEIDLYRKYSNYFGYVFYLMRAR